MLRDYQIRTINDLNQWFENNPVGNPVVVMPTGSGKSWVIGAYCKYLIDSYTDIRILMLSHVKELIEQNADKLLAQYPNAPMGIYCNGLGVKQVRQITYGSIQSLRKKSEELGIIDVVIVDECHLISHKNEGGYRMLLNKLLAVNARMRVIGFTATPFRLGKGYITRRQQDNDDVKLLFEDVIEPAGIQELLANKFLAPLRSKVTNYQYDVSQVAIKHGDYSDSELSQVIDIDDTNKKVVAEIISLAEDRTAWLIFCVDIEHANHIAALLNENGVPCKSISSICSDGERESILRAFRSGSLKALTNVNILTTGFDHPNIDLIILLRPTKSISLYVQMAGRGMRIKTHCSDCKVLDFSGLIKEFGPINSLSIKNSKAKIKTKICSACNEVVEAQAAFCPDCGYVFEIEEKAEKIIGERKKGKSLDANAVIISGIGDDPIFSPQRYAVSSWSWRKHISKKSGKEMVKVTYYRGSKGYVSEYFPILNGGWATQKGWEKLDIISECAGTAIEHDNTLDEIVSAMQDGDPPIIIVTLEKEDGFEEVLKRYWTEPEPEIVKICGTCGLSEDCESYSQSGNCWRWETRIDKEIDAEERAHDLIEDDSQYEYIVIGGAANRSTPDNDIPF